MLIVDSRRGLGEQDAGMLEWVLARDRFAHVLLTKADKLNRAIHSGAARKRAARAPTPRSRRNCSPRTPNRDREARSVMDLAGSRPHKKRPRWLLWQPPRQTNPAWG
jgi:GTP-binding protein EngB required for normal cell division